MLPKHHAFVSYGSPSKLKEYAVYIAKELGVQAAGNPDFHLRDYSSGGQSLTLDVDEARVICDLSVLKSTGGIKVFVIGANSITRQAQNAFLKTLEEPTEDTIFAFLVPKGVLIGTVTSRVMEIQWNPKTYDDSFAKEFLAASLDSRSTMLASIIKDKDKEGARALLDKIERILASDMHTKEVRDGLTELAHMRNYLGDPSSSTKMLLEHISLVLPKR